GTKRTPSAAVADLSQASHGFGRRRAAVADRGHTEEVSERIRAAIRAEGIVQGVGFRPFVYALATSLGLSGHVGNDADGVFAEVEGPADAVSMFLRQLQANPPPLARIDRVTTRPLALAGLAEFVIAASQPG